MGLDVVVNQLDGKRILILGFGREGKSSYRFIRKHLPTVSVVIADENPDLERSLFENDPYTETVLYEKDTELFTNYDIVLKSPGICLKNKLKQIDISKISSQTDLFLQAFSPQCIGVTGTKGKSTTTSLLFHVLKNLYPNVLIAGNIGIPLFDVVEQMGADTKIVIELSSHQLEFIRKSPHISILLNLFEEHLDHYNSYADYQQAKFNIAHYQSDNDYFIYNANQAEIAYLLNETPVKPHRIGFSFQRSELSDSFVENDCFCLKKNDKLLKTSKIKNTFPLQGEHNLENVAAAIAALGCSLEDVDIQKINDIMYSFKPLPHRLEFLGEVNGILFYNDSISTVPQAAIAAVKALKNVNTIILGGMDRGIDYSPLADFLEQSNVENLIFTGDAGKKMMNLFKEMRKKHFFFCVSYPEIVKTAKKCTKKGTICLLSPAAASYDMFKNFEHRGDAFRELVLN
ncbi:MAG: UDP-N-acetylmuramoyl-L-alanine--D-glutamate ligase [Lentimicrobiaceae bacterium]|nr:UDP-N-acetylmuramoyl-L-alanine--D-glutamate ligase [Lentimicrobiaceae bacterium]